MLSEPQQTRHMFASQPIGSNDEYGWYEDLDSPRLRLSSSMSDMHCDNQDGTLITRALSLPIPTTQPPMYILESSLRTQQLWYETAGQKPKQPNDERKYFERLWLRNFDVSEIDNAESYKNSATLVTPDGEPKMDDDNENDTHENLDVLRAEDDLMTLRFTRSESHDSGEVATLFKDRGPFSKTVSKSFLNHKCASMTIQIPTYKISRFKNGEVYARFLVVVALSGVSFGVWKRHNDFKELANSLQKKADESACDDSAINIEQVTDGISMTGQGCGQIGGAIDGGVTRMVRHSGSHHESTQYKNSLLSWECILQKKRWYRCLEHGYLTLKCFLLERFMHDVLFESQTPELICDFLGMTSSQ